MQLIFMKSEIKYKGLKRQWKEITQKETGTERLMAYLFYL